MTDANIEEYRCTYIHIHNEQTVSDALANKNTFKSRMFSHYICKEVILSAVFMKFDEFDLRHRKIIVVYKPVKQNLAATVGGCNQNKFLESS